MNITMIEARARSLGAKIYCTSRTTGNLRGESAPHICNVLVEFKDDDILLVRHGLRSEGRSPKRAKIVPGARGEATLDLFLKNIADLQAREVAIANHGIDNIVYPPWAFSVDALVLEIAKQDGIDLVLCSKPAVHPRTYTMQNGRLATAEEAWQWSRTTHAVRGHHGNADPGSGRSLDVEMKGSPLIARVLTPRSRPITLREEPRGTWLLLPGIQLPDTVLGALKGRSVNEIVEGLGSDHTIISAESRENQPWLKIKGPRVPLVAAPEGVETEWLDLNKGKI